MAVTKGASNRAICFAEKCFVVMLLISQYILVVIAMESDTIIACALGSVMSDEDHHLIEAAL